jgi:hypothetical protein
MSENLFFSKWICTKTEKQQNRAKDDVVLPRLLVSKGKLVQFCFLKLISHPDPRQKSLKCHPSGF